MNKATLLDKIGTKTGLKKRDALAFLDAFEKTVIKAIKEGDPVRIVGFGTFCGVDCSERTARNPRTGESITVKACRSPKFRPGKTLKEAVNQK